MIRPGKETDTLDLGDIVGSGGRLTLVLEPNKYQKPPDCSCGTSYDGHGTRHPKLPEVLASWRQVYFRHRYHHSVTEQCDNDGKTLKVGPTAYLSQWAQPLLDSLYVLGLSNMMISNLLPEGVVSQAAVWRRVRDLDPRGLAIHDLYRRNREDKRRFTESFTMRVIDPPTAGLEVIVKRPIHQLTKRWIDERVQRSQPHPTQGSLSFNLI